MASKRLEKKTAGEDFISRLPDDVLAHILSRLDTEEAVKTSILSSRWKNQWTFIVANPKKFKIYADLPRLREWMCFAIERNVHNLTLKVEIRMEMPVIRIPQTILTCQNLVKLNLGRWDAVFDIPDSTVCFPSLKILSIFVEYPDMVLMQKLFQSCPVLEELTVDGHLKLVPTLKILKISLSMINKIDATAHKFVVKAPNLEFLYIADDSLVSFMVDETPFLSKVFLVGKFDVRLYDIHPTMNEAKHAMQLLRAANHAKFLSLSVPMTGVLTRALEGNFPSFTNLIRLEFGYDMFYHWVLLPDFLNNSPNLVVLILKKDMVYFDTDDRIVRFPFESKSLPPCLGSHVKIIRLQIKEGVDDELRLVEYFLKNCKVLQRLYMDYDFHYKLKKFQRQILKFPRASPICKIEFRNTKVKGC
ncbi:hypothetical protein Ddye_010970 [Dipteronia dyeriana]|uniref:F-box domain-containing protein n=1 Tax=Dipteronia dyeriana TaxID=168575 RepID=A0AAD9XEI9_9ROSI|nr:hypothetical protein Ddye_010970 [Dipteronia dyeriana]